MHRSLRHPLALALGFTVVATAANARAGIAFSPDGAHVAISAPSDRGVLVLDLESGLLSTLTHTPSSGYAFNWSPDSANLGFKVLHDVGDGYLQEPMVYDAETGALRSLAAPSHLAGVPSFSAHGDIAYTLGHEAIVVSAGGIESRYDLGQYVNLAVLSPDGRRLAFNAPDDSIWVIDLATLERHPVSQEPFYAPSWAPGGNRLLLRGINGTVACADLESSTVVSFGHGVSPAWLPDGEHVLFTATEVPRGDGREPPATLQTIRFDGTGRRILSGVSGYDARVSPDGKALVLRPSMTAAPVVRSLAPEPGHGSPAAVPLMSLVSSQRDLKAGTPLQSAGPQAISRLDPVKIENVPYLHQVYDTPNNFDGNWACNATSAVMTLAFYGVIDPWDTTVSVPTPHVSHYGNYVSEVYTVNGHKLDVGSADPNGNMAYGGYGYIVQGDWEDTKGHMAEYIEFHGPSSAVDWSPTWEKVKSEIDDQHPFVVLTSITSAGHYIVDIGYHSDQHTAIFNDPYGNKNDGYMNYEGAGVLYDWPGYNNGYSSLTTVHCFIWSRGTVEPPADAGTEPDALATPDAEVTTDASTTSEASTPADAATTTDAGFVTDAGTGTDAAAKPDGSGAWAASDTSDDGCACSSAGRGRGGNEAAWGLLALALASVIRRRVE